MVDSTACLTTRAMEVVSTILLGRAVHEGENGQNPCEPVKAARDRENFSLQSINLI